MMLALILLAMLPRPASAEMRVSTLKISATGNVRSIASQINGFSLSRLRKDSPCVLITFHDPSLQGDQLIKWRIDGTGDLLSVHNQVISTCLSSRNSVLSIETTKANEHFVDYYSIDAIADQSALWVTPSCQKYGLQLSGIVSSDQPVIGAFCSEESPSPKNDRINIVLRSALGTLKFLPTEQVTLARGDTVKKTVLSPKQKPVGTVNVFLPTAAAIAEKKLTPPPPTANTSTQFLVVGGYSLHSSKNTFFNDSPSPDQWTAHQIRLGAEITHRTPWLGRSWLRGSISADFLDQHSPNTLQGALTLGKSWMNSLFSLGAAYYGTLGNSHIGMKIRVAPVLEWKIDRSGYDGWIRYSPLMGTQFSDTALSAQLLFHTRTLYFGLASEWLNRKATASISGYQTFGGSILIGKEWGAK